MIILIILILLIAAAFIYGISVNNSLVQLDNDVDESFSQIDVQLKRRNDLIPNLVNTVKGYANFESGTLEKVTEMRGQMIHIDPNQGSTSDNSVTRQQIMNTSNQLSGALKSLFAVSENYPQLQANSDFKQLMNELSDTEDKIAFARQEYNNTVKAYNVGIETFPRDLIANMKNYTKHQMLITPEAERKTPKVNFGTSQSN